jgi:NAD(P)-dependent dehydrogenase (short-subunit alcohol dehydrogenase family)
MKTNTFNGKAALIIGGTSGMGKATSQALLEEGINVIVASKTQQSIDDAITVLSENGGKVTGLKVDLTDQDSVYKFIGELNNISEIDYLVNASGIFRPKPFLGSSVEEYDALLDINRGFFIITKTVAGKMKENGKGGAIVNIGSYWSTHAIKGTPTAAYAMAKAGLHAFTQQIAMELAEFKIRVNAIAPGVVEPNVLTSLLGSADQATELYQGLNSIHPLGTPERQPNHYYIEIPRKPHRVTFSSGCDSLSFDCRYGHIYEFIIVRGHDSCRTQIVADYKSIDRPKGEACRILSLLRSAATTRSLYKPN